MGRATEFFDFINQEDISKKDFRVRYGSLGDTSQLRKVRQGYRKEKAKREREEQD